jgi:hypothetical protein
MRNFTIVSLFAFFFVVGCGRKEKAEEEIQIPQFLELELKKNKEGADILVLSDKGLPKVEQESEAYNLYLCWVDESAPPGGSPIEKRIELRGGSPGGGGSVRTIGLNAHVFEKGSSYYGRGRVCAIAVSVVGTYISNVVTVPNEPDAEATQADRAAAMRLNGAPTEN